MTRTIAAPLVLIFACLSLSVAMGCGDGGPPLIRVTGVVTLEGKPLEDAAVMFTPDLSTPQTLQAEAVTGSDGSFSLRTGTRIGAIPGKYHVVITPAPPPPPPDPEDPSFADDPYMADLSRTGYDPGEVRRKGKRATPSFEHIEDREITTDIPQIHEFEVRLK